MSSPSASSHEGSVWPAASFDKLLQDINIMSGESLEAFLSQKPTELPSGAAGSRGGDLSGLSSLPLPSFSQAETDSIFMDALGQCSPFDFSSPFSPAPPASHHNRPVAPLRQSSLVTNDISNLFAHCQNHSSTTASSPTLPTTPFSTITDPGPFDFDSILSDLRPNVPSPPASEGSVPLDKVNLSHMLGASFKSSEDEPLFVNAKQYHRILKRRAARSRFEEMNRLSKARKVSTQYTQGQIASLPRVASSHTYTNLATVMQRRAHEGQAEGELNMYQHSSRRC